MAKAKIKHFLLVFDHSQGKLVDTEEFGLDSDAALAAYARCEEKHSGDSTMDILLVGSDSLETVKATHANYFDGSAAVSRLLARFTSVDV